jgi:N-terminal acetyltransferase B complex catalytic subunit
MNDLLTFNNVNMDTLTETYNIAFYVSYMAQWPESFRVAKAMPWCESTTTSATAAVPILMGYVLGKAEGEGTLWHGHVSAVTVAPEYRRLQLAKTLMGDFERLSERKQNYFVDLFVRESNHLAIRMYEKFGYRTYRKVLGYYSGELPENALDMRKALSRDPNKTSMIPLDHDIYPDDLEW